MLALLGHTNEFWATNNREFWRGYQGIFSKNRELNLPRTNKYTDTLIYSYRVSGCGSSGGLCFAE